ncbi:MAG: rod shape-determining protein MreC [Myxococcales bacterium]|jgi:rod shape-determining protein MreC
MNYFQTIRDAAILLALVIIPAAFLRANLRDPSELSWLDRGLLQVSGPVQYVGQWAADGATSLIEEYVYLVDVERNNDHLRAENDRLRREMRVLRADAQRTYELESLLGLRERLETETLSARVIAKDISPSFRVVRLAVDQGERSGLRAGMPVISNDGLVGQIRRVSGRFADVLLTVDPESHVDVVVGERRARGRLEGIGERERYRCLIQFDRPDDQVAVGDEVFTSGLGKKFPASILVGYVSRIGDQEFGLHQEGEVTPSVDFTRLEEVLILTSGPKDAESR